MSALPGKPVSVFTDGAPGPAHPPLATDLEVDVVVVGAGVTGLSTALRCAQDGASVAVLEAAQVAGAVTSHTTAKVTALHSLIYDELRSHFGEKGASTYAAANQAGLEQVARWVDELGIDCAFRRRSAYTYVEDPERRDAIEREVDAACAAGLGARLVTDTPLPFGVAAAVVLDDQAEFDSYAYGAGLARALAERGGRIFEHTRVTGLEERGGPAVVTDAGHRVRAGHVVVATHMPVFDRGLFFTRLTAKRSYAIAVVAGDSVPDGMFISAQEPTRSLRVHMHQGRLLLIVGGEGHTAGEDSDPRERYRTLERWAAERLGAAEVTHRWSAQDLQPADGVPYVGRYTPVSGRVLTATGYRKWGFTNATMAAGILADTIAGRPNPWASFFDTSRFTPLRSAKGIASEALKDARHLVGGRLALATARSVDALAPGEGAVVRAGSERVAAYREEDGTLRAVSPICTHLGCVVAFNAAERSWDCPCHGSRFAPDGTVLEGPATRPLAAAQGDPILARS